MYKNILVLPDGTEISSGPGAKNAITSIQYTQMVNSGDELTIGSVCSNMIEASLFTPKGNLQITAGDELSYYRADDGGVRTKVGLFIVEEPIRPTANTLKIVGYDRVTKLDKDLSAWVESLNGWPYSVNTFATMVCQICGLTFVEQGDLPNLDFPIRQWKKSGTTGRKIMRWLGEIVCRYVYADPDGNIRFGWYKDSGKSYGPSGDSYYFSGSLSYENYQVSPVEAVQIRLADNDSGAPWPDVSDDTNSYVITGNHILASYVTEDILNYLNSISKELARVTYTPCKLSVRSSVDLNAGDIIQITDKNGKTFSTYVMSKITSGQKDTLNSTGSHRRDSTTAENNKSDAEKQADIESAANSSAKNKVDELDKALNQEEVFKRLTNNGKMTGLFMEDGNLYINASYIKTGEFLADLIKAGAIKSRSNSNSNFILNLDNGSILVEAAETGIDKLGNTQIDNNTIRILAKKNDGTQENRVFISGKATNTNISLHRENAFVGISADENFAQLSLSVIDGNFGYDATITATPNGTTLSGINSIDGIAYVESDSSATNKKYVDDCLANALPLKGGTLTGELRVNNSTANGIRMWTDGEGGNIRIYPPASNHYTDYWDIDCYDGGMRIFAYKKSTNPNGGPGHVFPLTLGTDGAIKVGNTAKTRANLGVAPAAESTASPNCYYRTVDGVTEWINPPMAAGTEYRTTERFKGKVVYTKLINYGKLAASGTQVSISLGCTATNLVDFNILTTLSSGTQYNFPAFNFSSAGAMLTGYFNETKTAFVVKCHQDLSAATAVATVKYTKD